MSENYDAEKLLGDRLNELEKLLVDRLNELEKKEDPILDAVKELTKITGDLAKEWEKWRKAGKF